MEVRNGRDVVIKRRGWFGWHVAKLANFYFRIAKIPIRFCGDWRTWQQWEVDCFRMFNPPMCAFAIDPKRICLERMPGDCLWQHMKRKTLDLRMLEAAAKELRRAHCFWSSHFNGPWSHGDSTMSNFIYDSANDRVRLIDFEIVHDASMSAAQRHADDLLVFLLDLASIVSRRRWLPMALTFLKAYGDCDAIGELIAHLSPPRGLGRIWYKVRTNFRRRGKVSRRLESLRYALVYGVPEEISGCNFSRPVESRPTKS